MQDFLSALGLVLVIEGVLWALFPAGMKAAMARALASETTHLRTAGLLFAALGVLVVWLVRG